MKRKIKVGKENYKKLEQIVDSEDINNTEKNEEFKKIIKPFLNQDEEMEEDFWSWEYDEDEDDDVEETIVVYLK